MPSAGDVERFTYCAHNWWLAKRGIEGDAGEGVSKHEAMGRAQQHAEEVRLGAQQAMNWSFRLVLAASSVTILALELVYLQAHPQHWVFLSLALVLVAASSGLLVISLQNQAQARKEQAAAGLVPGELQDTDLFGEGALLVDPETRLQGRPDYVLDTPHGVVPVEVKTGSTPDHPFESHQMQLASYIHLLRKTGKKVPYGLINYPGGVFRVEASDGLEARLKQILDRIERANRLGVADRDHSHVARCTGCARRSACDQAL